MKFGIQFANLQAGSTPDGARVLARAAEAAGFDSLWAVEHVVHPVAYASQYPFSADGRMPIPHTDPLPDPLIWLTWAAAVTSRVRLCTGVLILPERNPAILAKETATLSYLSGGRFELGIGLGWLKEEYEALGVPWERRGERADEYVEALRSLWARDGASFGGEFVNFSGVSVNPKPPGGAIPICVGAFSKAGARRAGRLGDGFYPGSGNRDRNLALIEAVQSGSSTASAVDDLMREVAEFVDIARQTAADHGRDAAALRVVGSHPLVVLDPACITRDPLATVQEMAALGADEYIYPAYFLAHPSVDAACANFGELVISPYRQSTAGLRTSGT